MKVLIAAGGTGGHVIPALTLANAIRDKYPSSRIVFVGTQKGFEAKAVPSQGFELEFLNLSGLKGAGWMATLYRILLIPVAMVRCFFLLRSIKPDVVFGVGGYVSGPLLFLAGCSSVFTAILEPNAVAGFSNRCLGPFVDRIYVAFDVARSSFPEKKVRCVGNLLREEIKKVLPPDFSQGLQTVLVFGGSQGARSINQAVTRMLEKHSEFRLLHWIHQTGQADYSWVKEFYDKHSISAEVEPFFEKMDQVYQQSQMVIARSGSSVLEIAAVGRPSILIPYPYSADDHQQENARQMVRIGAAVMIDDKDLHEGKLDQVFSKLYKNIEQLKQMSGSARNHAQLHATQEIVRDFEESLS
ncbi:MAG: undecaprenyldiphospho-muramoylpentapeptide beta-N-acetylglucosaminyltransferase [Bdellovibrionota bacterium]